MIHVEEPRQAQLDSSFYSGRLDRVDLCYFYIVAPLRHASYEYRSSLQTPRSQRQCSVDRNELN